MRSRIPHLFPSRERSLPAAAMTALIALLTILFSGVPTPALAEDSSGSLSWGIAPGSAEGPDGRSAINLLADPGTIHQEHVVVTNHGTTPLTLEVAVADAITGSSGAFELVDEAPVDAGSWIVPDQARVTVPGRSSAVVPLKIDVPQEAGPGDRSAGITVALRSTTQTGVGVEHRVGVRAHVRVTGPIRAAFEVEDLSAAYSQELLPFSRGHGHATLRVSNTGNVRISGTPEIRVKGPFGVGKKTVRAAPIHDMLPGSTIVIPVDLGPIPPLGRHLVEVSLTPTESSGQPLGGVPAATASNHMWTVPWATLALLVVLSGAVILTRITVRRRRAMVGSVQAALRMGPSQASKPSSVTSQ